MKDFGRWMADQKAAPVVPVESEEEREDGLYLSVSGDWWGPCCACGEDYEIFCTPDEFEYENSYCGGSPRCCP